MNTSDDYAIPLLLSHICFEQQVDMLSDGLYESYAADSYRSTVVTVYSVYRPAGLSL